MDYAPIISFHEIIILNPIRKEERFITGFAPWATSTSMGYWPLKGFLYKGTITYWTNWTKIVCVSLEMIQNLLMDSQESNPENPVWTQP